MNTRISFDEYLARESLGLSHVLLQLSFKEKKDRERLKKFIYIHEKYVRQDNLINTKLNFLLILSEIVKEIPKSISG